MARSSQRDQLRAIPLFSELKNRELDRIANITSELEVVAGTDLVRQHAPALDALIVIEGAAEVLVDGVTIAALGPGDSVGEIGLIDGKPRTATVTATTDMVVWVIEPQRFSALLDSVPSLTRSLLVTLAGRLRQADERLAGP